MENKPTQPLSAEIPESVQKFIDDQIEAYPLTREDRELHRTKLKLFAEFGYRLGLTTPIEGVGMKWIKASEPPNHSNEVIVFERDSFIGDRVTTAFYHSDENKWRFYSDMYACHPITHWMPLPAPPSESQSSNDYVPSQKDVAYLAFISGHANPQLKAEQLNSFFEDWWKDNVPSVKQLQSSSLASHTSAEGNSIEKEWNEALTSVPVRVHPMTENYFKNNFVIQKK